MIAPQSHREEGRPPLKFIDAVSSHDQSFCRQRNSIPAILTSQSTVRQSFRLLTFDDLPRLITPPKRSKIEIGLFEQRQLLPRIPRRDQLLQCLIEQSDDPVPKDEMMIPRQAVQHRDVPFDQILRLLNDRQLFLRALLFAHRHSLLPD